MKGWLPKGESLFVVAHVRKINTEKDRRRKRARAEGRGSVRIGGGGSERRQE